MNSQRLEKLKNRIGAIGLLTFFAGVIVGLGVYTVLREAFEAGIVPETGMQLKDWAGFYLALLAFTFSLGAFFYNRYKAKKDSFLAIHEKLIALDIQEGRRLLFTKVNSPEDAKLLEEHDIEAYQKVNRALAMYDVLGLYVSRRYVDKSIVLEEWGQNLSKARWHGQHFMEHRRQKNAPSKWKHFDALSEEAEALYPEYASGSAVTGS